MNDNYGGDFSGVLSHILFSHSKLLLMSSQNILYLQIHFITVKIIQIGTRENIDPDSMSYEVSLV